jgi:hypothetical protein
MINNFSGGRICNQPVHIYIFSINVPIGINFFCLKVCGPFEEIKKLVICGINDGDFSFGKGNKSDLGIFRLDDDRAVDYRNCAVASAR